MGHRLFDGSGISAGCGGQDKGHGGAGQDAVIAKAAHFNTPGCGTARLRRFRRLIHHPRPYGREKTPNRPRTQQRKGSILPDRG
jgi:hypothetical protein